jgi:hypothetical protein
MRQQWTAGGGERRVSPIAGEMLRKGRWQVTGSGEAELRAALRDWRELRKKRLKVGGVDVLPACLHGVILQNQVNDVAGDLEDIKNELAWIRRVIVAAVVAAAFGTLMRAGGLIP